MTNCVCQCTYFQLTESLILHYNNFVILFYTIPFIDYFYKFHSEHQWVIWNITESINCPPQFLVCSQCSIIIYLIFTYGLVHEISCDTANLLFKSALIWKKSKSTEKSLSGTLDSYLLQNAFNSFSVFQMEWNNAPYCYCLKVLIVTHCNCC